MNGDNFSYEEDMEMLDEKIAYALGYHPHRRQVHHDERVIVTVADPRRPYNPIVEIEGDDLESAMDVLERKLGARRR
jgi:hypothetical protein